MIRDYDAGENVSGSSRLSAPSFLLLAAGLLMSVITFCSEISLKRCKKRTQTVIRTDNFAPRSIHVRVMAK